MQSACDSHEYFGERGWKTLILSLNKLAGIVFEEEFLYLLNISEMII